MCSIWHLCWISGRDLTLIREFLGLSPSALSGKKSKAQKHIKIDAMLSSGFSPKNPLGDNPAFWIFSMNRR